MYERIFRNVLFPLYEGPIRRRYTQRYLREYEASQWLDAADLEKLQLQKLNRLLAHCWDNVPFLRQYWTQAGLEAAPLESPAELARYPAITKQIISENYANMRAVRNAGRVLSKTTGGSTGDPFKFEYSEDSYARRMAMMWRGYRWCGADLGRRTAYVWANPGARSGFRATKERLYHRAFNRIFLDAFAMTESNLGDYVDELQRYRPKIIVGYVAPLVMLGRWMLEHGRSIDPPVAVITGAEALTTPDRDQLKKAFGAPVFNTYGCREFMLLASECERLDGLHISADHLVLETVDAEGQPVTGGSGDVCVTDLHNYAMPFVRYLNGDRATFADRPCGCGRGLPILETVDGRILDIIVTRDGHMVPGEFFVHSMLEFPDIRQYQVVQLSPERLDVRIVPRTKLSADERELMKSRFASRMGTDIDIAIREVDSIPKTPSGKRRITVSHIQ